MAQPREPAFQQLSPESSKGGADSYKNEGTPDTHLTPFSPEGSSAKSSKLANPLSLAAAADPQPPKFPIQPGNAFRGPNGLQLEKDPFVTAVTDAKAEQKLSATASAFRPFSTPSPAAHGSEESAVALDKNQDVALISSSLSTELNLSRCFVIASPSKALSETDVDQYISVRSSPHIDIHAHDSLNFYFRA